MPAPAVSESSIANAIEEEQRIERMLKQNELGTMARYFRKIDVVTGDVQRVEKKLDDHCKKEKAYNGRLGRVMPYLRDAVTVVTVAMVTVLTGVVVYP